MSAIKLIKKVDTKNRVVIPNGWAKSGDYVSFEITRGGNLLIKKEKTDEANKETLLNEEEDAEEEI